MGVGHFRGEPGRQPDTQRFGVHLGGGDHYAQAWVGDVFRQICQDRGGLCGGSDRAGTSVCCDLDLRDLTRVD